MKTLSVEEKREAFLQWRAAVIALTNCWDSLRELESITGIEIEVDEISPYAGDDGFDEAAFDEWLESAKAVH